jgi:hypothetical protein
MIKDFLNKLLANGVWFAALLLNLLSAAITTIVCVGTAIVIKWVNTKL